MRQSRQETAFTAVSIGLLLPTFVAFKWLLTFQSAGIAWTIGVLALPLSFRERLEGPWGTQFVLYLAYVVIAMLGFVLNLFVGSWLAFVGYAVCLCANSIVLKHFYISGRVKNAAPDDPEAL